MFLHKFRHVDAHHRAVIIEEEARQCLGELGLTNTRGAQKQEGAKRSVRLLQAGTGPAHGGGDGAHGIGLPNDALAKFSFHLE